MRPLYPLVLCCGFLGGCGGAVEIGPDGEDGIEGASLSSADPCYTDQTPTDFVESEVNLEMNDYAAMYLDAGRPACAPKVADRMRKKLGATLAFNDAGRTLGPIMTLPLRGWLWGAATANLFAAALELQKGGYAVPDDLLQRARDLQAAMPLPQDLNCGVPLNSCMDDYTVSAGGYAFIAAYEAMRGRDPAPFIAKTNEALALAFTPLSRPEGHGSICYYVDGSNPVDCAGDAHTTDLRADLASGKIRIIGVNHSQENPMYGLGLMTEVADACLALKSAGASCDLDTVDERTGLSWKEIAVGLIQHGQRKSLSDGSKFNDKDCIKIADPTIKLNCSDETIGEGGYHPKQIPINQFYTQNGISVPARIVDDGIDRAAFQFDVYEEPRLTYERHNFFGLGRYVAFELFANEFWATGKHPQYVKFTAPGDNDGNACIDHSSHGEIGSAVGPNGQTDASGFACCPGLRPSRILDAQFHIAQGAQYYCYFNPGCVPVGQPLGVPGPDSCCDGLAPDAGGICRAATTVKIAWAQSGTSAGFGPPDGLVIGGKAGSGAVAEGVTFSWTDLSTTPNTTVTTEAYKPVPNPQGQWYHSIAPADPNHRYLLRATFGGATHVCTYEGQNQISWCN